MTPTIPGYDMASARENRPGIEDSEVCAWAHREERVTLTNDKDFGRLIFQEQLPNRRVILSKLL